MTETPLEAPAHDIGMRGARLFQLLPAWRHEPLNKEATVLINLKTASKAERQAYYNEIAREMGDDQFFTRKELHYLPEVLQDGERVLAFTSGMKDGNTWLIVLTDRRILFLDKGMVFGLKQESIPLNRVNSISGNTGLMLGKIVITDGAKNHEISNVWKKTVKRFTNRCQEELDRLARLQYGGSRNDSPAIDPYEQLEKLAGLKEKGIITAEEFETEKSKLLER
jgi:hypothetical protein